MRLICITRAQWFKQHTIYIESFTWPEYAHLFIWITCILFSVCEADTWNFPRRLLVHLSSADTHAAATTYEDNSSNETMDKVSWLVAVLTLACSLRSPRRWIGQTCRCRISSVDSTDLETRPANSLSALNLAAGAHSTTLIICCDTSVLKTTAPERCNREKWPETIAILMMVILIEALCIQIMEEYIQMDKFWCIEG